MVAMPAGTLPDTTLNYDMEDPQLRDIQLRGAMSGARLASRIRSEEWVVWHVCDGALSEVTRYVDGYRAWRDDAGRLHLA
jgi:hypothetical protein